MRQNDRSHDSGQPWCRPRCLEQLRARVVDVVRSRQRPLALSELASALRDGACVHDAERPGGDGDRLLVYLHHVVLPKLHDDGSIEYDPTRRVVTEFGG